MPRPSTRCIPAAALLGSLLALGGLPEAGATTPSHLYELNGSFADALGGPALNPLGGSLGASSYSFAANQGLSLDNAVGSSVYTIDTSFALDQTNGYRRLLDFKNALSDTGLYNLSTALNFYNVATGGNGAFADGQTVRLTVSRDAAGNFSGYINGVLQISFNDTAGLAQFSGPNQVARFFVDDNAVGGEASAGSVDYIAIYDTALSAAEIANLHPAVPEPQSYALLLSGLAALAWVKRRADKQR